VGETVAARGAVTITAVTDRGLIEKLLIAEAPGTTADALRPIASSSSDAVAKRLIVRPDTVRKVRARDLEHVIAEVERIGGLEAVHRVLQRDRRERARDLSSMYGAPLSLTEPDGAVRSPERLFELVLGVPHWHTRTVVRDLLVRLGDVERYTVLHLLLSEPEESLARARSKKSNAPVDAYQTQLVRNSMVHTWLAVAVLLVFEGVLDLTRVERTAKRSIIGTGATGTLHRFSADDIIEALSQPSTRRSNETIMQALWAGDCPHLTEPLATAWRKGAYKGLAIVDQITALLAVRGALSEEELLAFGPTIPRQHVSLVVAATKPCQRDIILRALPAETRLYDVSDTLESAAGMSTWALCDVVRRGDNSVTIRWLRKTSSSSVLHGERGVAVAETIVEHWEAERVKTLIEDIGSYRYVAERGDLQHLALHAPAASAVLAAGGTLGTYARRHAYNALGSDPRRWEYLLELLPKWNGSLAQLVKAADKLGRPWADCRVAPAKDGS